MQDIHEVKFDSSWRNSAFDEKISKLHDEKQEWEEKLRKLK